MGYANFMPGGFLPFQDSCYLNVVYNFAWVNHISVGGPDLLPYDPVQMANSYGFIKKSYKKVPTGIAVQDGTIDYINPNTKQKITAWEIYQFAEGYLKLSYIFWGTEQPFFSSEVLPLLKHLNKSYEVFRKASPVDSGEAFYQILIHFVKIQVLEIIAKISSG